MGRLTALLETTAVRVAVVVLTCLWIAAVAAGVVVKPLGPIGLGFACGTALMASYAILRGGVTLILTSLGLVVIWSICNTYGAVADPHEKLQTYAYLDALLGGVMGVLCLRRREPWRIGIFFLAIVQLVLHTKFAWLWDFSLPVRRGYIMSLNMTYAFELVALFAGVLTYDPTRVVDDMPPLPEFDAGWLECVDKADPGLV